jgi:hypothetical protein
MPHRIANIIEGPRQTIKLGPRQLLAVIKRLTALAPGVIFSPVLRSQVALLELQSALPKPIAYHRIVSDAGFSFNEAVRIFASLENIPWKGWLLQLRPNKVEHEISLTADSLTFDGERADPRLVSPGEAPAFLAMQAPGLFLSQCYQFGDNCGLFIAGDLPALPSQLSHYTQPPQDASRFEAGEYLYDFSGAVPKTDFLTMLGALQNDPHFLGGEFLQPSLSVCLLKVSFFRNQTDGSFQLTVELPQVAKSLQSNLRHLL